MDGTRSPGLLSSLDKAKEGASSDDNSLELSLGPPRKRKCSTLSQERSLPGPVVGWPPVGSFRKNLTSNKNAFSPPPLPNKFGEDKRDTKPETPHPTDENLFVKIYMEGFPIGRKVNLGACDSYKKLSVAIHELFGGLVAVDRSTEATATEEHGLVDGNGEYTLLYEDKEGDRILAGDVPWIMFVSTAKKLHLIRSSLGRPSTSSLGKCYLDKINPQ